MWPCPESLDRLFSQRVTLARHRLGRLAQGAQIDRGEYPAGSGRRRPRMVQTARATIAALSLAACAGGTPRGQTADPRTAHEAAPAPAPALGHPGCFVLARVDGSEQTIVHAEDCARATVPASTFKIPHALIALQLGVIADPDAAQRWDGTPYPDMPTWQADHDLRTAIRESVVWYFQRTARRIGSERMGEWLRALHYGNEQATGAIDRFWLEGGSLQITGLQQLDFWQRLVRGELPIDRAHVDAVFGDTEATLDFWSGRLPEGNSPPASAAVLHAKTGTAWDDHGNVSWWAGVVDGPTGRWVFVSRVIDDGPDPGWSAAVHHGMQALRRLGAI